MMHVMRADKSYQMKEHHFGYQDGSPAFTFAFNTGSTTYDALYFYRDNAKDIMMHEDQSPKIALQKKFNMDGFLQEELIFAKDKKAIIGEAQYRFQNKKLVRVMKKENNKNYSPLTPKSKLSFLDRITFTKETPLKQKDLEAFHKKHTVLAEELYSNINDSLGFHGHVEGEVKRAEKLNKEFEKIQKNKTSHLRIV